MKEVKNPAKRSIADILASFPSSSSNIDDAVSDDDLDAPVTKRKSGKHKGIFFSILLAL